MKILAERLRSLRIENGLTLKEVEQGTGIKKGLINHYEKDIKNPSLEYFVKLVDFYKVSSDYLLGTNDQEENLEDLKIKFFCLDKANRAYVSKAMSAKEKGISPDRIAAIETL